jgi:hypothetical protein
VFVKKLFKSPESIYERNKEFMEFDPDWFDEEYYEEYCNVGNEDLPEDENFSDGTGSALDNAAELGLALGFGDFISDERLKELSTNLTRQVNKENLSIPITFTSVHSYKKEKKPRSLEKFVDDLCKGKISIDDKDY